MTLLQTYLANWYQNQPQSAVRAVAFRVAATPATQLPVTSSVADLTRVHDRHSD